MDTLTLDEARTEALAAWTGYQLRAATHGHISATVECLPRYLLALDRYLTACEDAAAALRAVGLLPERSAAR